MNPRFRVLARLTTLTVVGFSCATLLGTGAASAHDSLTSTSPGSGEVVTEKPGDVALTLSNPPLLKETLETGTISVTGPEGTSVSSGALNVVDATVSTEAGVEQPGDYNVTWKVVSSDGHPVEGSFAFTYAAPTTTTSTTTAAPQQELIEEPGAKGDDSGLEGLALGISILALIVAAVAAAYTRAQAVAAKRTLALDHEPLLHLTVGRYASISAPGRPPRGGGASLNLENRGNGTAHNIEVTPVKWSGSDTKLSITKIDGHKEHVLGPLEKGEQASVVATWRAADGKTYRKKLKT